MGTQKQDVLKKLRAGSLTKVDAIKDPGVLNLGSVVAALRRDGHKIKTHWKPVKTRRGWQDVAEYVLEEAI